MIGVCVIFGILIVGMLIGLYFSEKADGKIWKELIEETK